MSKTKKHRKLLKAAQMGKPYAQYQLGIWYQTGHEVEQDLHTAAEWMQCAAKSEYSPAKDWLTDYFFDDDANTQANA